MITLQGSIAVLVMVIAFSPRSSLGLEDEDGNNVSMVLKSSRSLESKINRTEDQNSSRKKKICRHLIDYEIEIK